MGGTKISHLGIFSDNAFFQKLACDSSYLVGDVNHRRRYNLGTGFHRINIRPDLIGTFDLFSKGDLFLTCTMNSPNVSVISYCKTLTWNNNRVS